MSIERLVNHAAPWATGVFIVIYTRLYSHLLNCKYMGGASSVTSVFQHKLKLTNCVEKAISLQITTDNQRLHNETV